jgi:hypothetical protein
MVDLNAVCKGGGIVCFSGGTDPRKAGLGGAALSWIIEHVAKPELPSEFALSHIGLIVPATDVPPAWILESTIFRAVSGPQENLIDVRLAEYRQEGGRAIFYAFQPSFSPDWDSVYLAASQLIAEQKAGRLHYGALHLGADLLAHEPLLRRAIDAFTGASVAETIEHMCLLKPDPVCSEMVGLLLMAGGVPSLMQAAGLSWLPNTKPVAGQVWGCTPEDIRDLPIWQNGVTLL